MLSLIIATYNRGERLTQTLNSLLWQTLPKEKWELIVVDNNSSDNTAEVVRHYTGLNPKYVFEPRQGLSYARNRGIAESSGEEIVMVDDDVILPADFLEVYSRFFDSNTDAVMVGGRVIPQIEGAAPSWMSRYPMMPIGGACDLGRRIFFRRGKSVVGANHAFRRRIIDEVGEYNPLLGRRGESLSGGEEKDLCLRIERAGYRINYLHDAWLYHLVPQSRLTRSYFTRLCYQIGQSERIRTLAISRRTYIVRLFGEAIRWGGAAVLALGFLLRGRAVKGKYLLLMRLQITKGLIEEA